MRRSGLTLSRAAWILLLAVLPQASVRGLPEPVWQYHTFQGERVILYYPSLVSPQDASAFTDSRDAAVQFVEGFLGARLDQRIRMRIDVRLISSIGHASNPSWDRPLVVFGLPFHRLATPGTVQGLELGAHEEAHIVAGYAWVTTTRNPALDEGLAVAIDFCYRPHGAYDPHAIAKGLRLLGRLAPLERLLTLPLLYTPTADDSLCIYMGGGSFFLFLFDTFELDLVARLFDLSASQPRTALPALFSSTFGAELREVEQAWHRYLDDYSNAGEFRAIRSVEAFTEISHRVMPLVEELERNWTEFPYQQVGPSELVAKDYQRLMGLLLSLGGYRVEDQSLDQTASVFEELKQTLRDVETHITMWLTAIKSFSESLDALSLLEETDYSRRIGKLEEASRAYATAGYTYMAGRAGSLLQAVNLCQEGRDALARGEMERAETAFRLARECLPEDSDHAMVFDIERLLVASRKLAW